MVVTIHDLAPLALPEIMGSAIRRQYARMLINCAATRAEAILTVSEFTASELRKRLNVPPEKITVTHPGIDASWPEIAVKHVETDHVPYVLYVGNIKPNKNLILLLEAYARVADSVPFCLLLAGRIRGFGTGDEAMIHRAKAMGDKVRFAGEVSDTELIGLYAGASALVLPSLYEGFGLPLLEAMKLRCPVLCSRAGSLPEVAGDAALYFDPLSKQELAEQLLQVADGKRMDELRRAGTERVRLFNFQDCAERSATVFNRLLEEKHG
jgi:glycosyltransferase involved in cell wall biosynthesis